MNDTGGVKVAFTKRSFRSRLRELVGVIVRHRILSIIILLTILAIIAIIFFIWRANSFSGDKNSSKTPTSKPLSIQGIESITQGGSKSAVETLKKAEAEAKTPEEKNRATGGLIAAYMNTNNPKAALEATERLNSADPSNVKYRAYQTAQIYERMGDYKTAIDFYQDALELAESAPDVDGLPKQDRINELKATIEQLSKKK